MIHSLLSMNYCDKLINTGVNARQNVDRFVQHTVTQLAD